jgi:recombination protein RecA
MTTIEEKKTEEKKPKKAATSANAVMMAKLRGAILKATGQKPLKPGDTAYQHVSTGSFNVDMLIGGTPVQGDPKQRLICPGFPRRRITEVFGAESSGKTTLALSAIAQAQKAGGTGILIDFEHAIDLSYAQKIGLSLDEDKMQVVQPDTMEQGFAMMYLGIASGVDIIVVDSIAAMVPKDELEKGFNDAAKIGAVARKFSIELPKFAMWLQKHPFMPGEKGKTNPDHPGTALVLINQMRALISTSGGGHGGDENTSGGKALKYYAFERLRLARIRSEVIERKDPMTGKKRRFPYGNVTDVKVVKSKIDGKQGHSTNIFIRYGYGIDDYFSVIETGVAQKVIKREGAFYTLGTQRFQGKDKFRKFLIENPNVFDALRVKLAQAVNATAQDAPDDIDEEDELLEGLDLEGGDDADDTDAGAEAIAEEVMDAGGGEESGG